ncbi:unnamed protein product, partial [Brenthis ino]
MPVGIKLNAINSVRICSPLRCSLKELERVQNSSVPEFQAEIQRMPSILRLLRSFQKNNVLSLLVHSHLDEDLRVLILLVPMILVQDHAHILHDRD